MGFEIDGVKWFLGGLGAGVMVGWLWAWWHVWRTRPAEPPGARDEQ